MAFLYQGHVHSLGDIYQGMQGWITWYTHLQIYLEMSLVKWVIMNIFFILATVY